MTTKQQPSSEPGNTREVWRMPRAGSLNALRLEREELPPPGPGEVRIAVRSVGLNLADVFACLGLYSATPAGPFVPGLEVAGVTAWAGQLLIRQAGESRTRLIVLMMLIVGAL
ncbi:MAG: hypothetical protein EHM24_31150, partial [Acidobacteria bacterium]